MTDLESAIAEFVGSRTMAALAPTSEGHLGGFRPCEGCSECAKVCPTRAIDPSKQPGAGYDRERCARFVLGMSERSGIGAKTCARCFGVCPWSKAQARKDSDDRKQCG
jgi:epoxyqueuosine reductase QueG